MLRKNTGRDDAFSAERDTGALRKGFRLHRRLADIPIGERMNAWTHGIGAVLALIGGGYLVWLSARTAPFAVTVSAVVFAASLLALYSASTAYHASAHPSRKLLLRRLDHCCIYLLIAGTYTPFAVMLGGAWGLFLLVTIWCLALTGIALKLTGALKNRWTSTVLYIAMGWLIIVAASPMLAHFDRQTLALLLAGGVCYTAGTPFYQSSRIAHTHSVWHGFVILGSGCHLAAVLSAVSSRAFAP